jgi:hypothetical protein
MKHITMVFDNRSDITLALNQSCSDDIEKEHPGYFDNYHNPFFRMIVAHRMACVLLSTYRNHLMDCMVASINLDTISIDLSNACCPLGDCRVLDASWKTLADANPKVVRFLGLRHNQEVDYFLTLRSESCAVKVEDEDYELVINLQNNQCGQWKVDDDTEGAES